MQTSKLFVEMSKLYPSSLTRCLLERWDHLKIGGFGGLYLWERRTGGEGGGMDSWLTVGGSSGVT
jgi:hypothetical protein